MHTRNSQPHVNLTHLILGRELGTIWGKRLNSQQTPAKVEQQLGLWAEKSFLRHCSAQYSELKPPPRSTIAASFSPSGAVVASTHGDHTVKIINSWTGQCIRVLDGHRRTPWVVRFNPIDPNMLVSGSLDHTVTLWRVSTGEQLQSYDFGKPIASIAFHPSGELLAVASGHKVYIWEYKKVATDVAPAFILKTRKSLRAIHFHPAGLPLLLTAEVLERKTTAQDTSAATAMVFALGPAPVLEMAAAAAAPAHAASAPAAATQQQLPRGHAASASGAAGPVRPDAAAAAATAASVAATTATAAPDITTSLYQLAAFMGELVARGDLTMRAGLQHLNRVLQAAGTGHHMVGGAQDAAPAAAGVPAAAAATAAAGHAPQVPAAARLPSLQELELEMQRTRQGNPALAAPGRLQAGPTEVQQQHAAAHLPQHPAAAAGAAGSAASSAAAAAHDAPPVLPAGSLQMYGLPTSTSTQHQQRQDQHQQQGGFSGTHVHLATAGAHVPEANVPMDTAHASSSGWHIRGTNGIQPLAVMPQPLGPAYELAWAWELNPNSSRESIAHIRERQAVMLQHQLPSTTNQEQPCIVNVNLWGFDPAKPRTPLSKALLTISKVVLCSEMGAHISRCGRFLAVCVAAEQQSSVSSEWQEGAARALSARVAEIKQQQRQQAGHWPAPAAAAAAGTSSAAAPVVGPGLEGSSDSDVNMAAAFPTAMDVDEQWLKPSSSVAPAPAPPAPAASAATAAEQPGTSSHGPHTMPNPGHSLDAMDTAAGAAGAADHAGRTAAGSSGLFGSRWHGDAGDGLRGLLNGSNTIAADLDAATTAAVAAASLSSQPAGPAREPAGSGAPTTSSSGTPQQQQQLFYELRVYSLDGPTFGQLLKARPILAAHCLTSIQFSPTSEHILVAYGRRHVSLCSLVVDGGGLVPVHTIMEIYRMEDMSLVRALPSLEDEVNVACFHPHCGGGVVYGTKEGKLRILRHDRRHPQRCTIPSLASRIDDELWQAERDGGQSLSASEDDGDAMRP